MGSKVLAKPNMPVVKKYWSQTVWVLAVVFGLGANLQRLNNVESNQEDQKKSLDEIRRYSISNAVEIATMRVTVENLDQKIDDRAIKTAQFRK